MPAQTTAGNYRTTQNRKNMPDTKEHKGIIIPKSIVWTVLITITISIISTFTRFEIGFKHLEKEIDVLRVGTQKEIEILNIKLSKEEELIRKTSERFEQINEKLFNIEKAITMKQDKKFLE